jgi:hypothetical protein
MWDLARDVNKVMAERDRLKALCEELKGALQGYEAAYPFCELGKQARAALKKAEQAPKP